MPEEGRFEPLLQMDILDAFEAAGCQELIDVPEFPKADPVRQLNCQDSEAAKIPSRPTALSRTADASFLFTVDWDSFFTLFYGPREFISEVVTQAESGRLFRHPDHRAQLVQLFTRMLCSHACPRRLAVSLKIIPLRIISVPVEFPQHTIALNHDLFRPSR